MPSNVAVEIVLSDEERGQLEAWELPAPDECAGAGEALADRPAAADGPPEHRDRRAARGLAQHGGGWRSGLSPSGWTG